MDIPVHNQILWEACALARERLGGAWIADPSAYFPLLARGSWMNDTNQVTVFSDALRKLAPKVGPPMKQLLQALWQLERREIIEKMRGVDLGLGTKAEAVSATATDIDAFGKYDRFDHLDVLAEDAREYAGKTIAATVTDTTTVVSARLEGVMSGSAEQRLSPGRITALGCALHTVADFFAHSNYVELLLWRLSRKDGGSAAALSPGIVALFNEPDAALFERDRVDYDCPLPETPDRVPRTNGIIWYGKGPAETPLVSSVFDGSDTAYSLTKMYAAHLEDTETQSVDQSELAMALLYAPARPIARAAWQLYSAYRNLLQGISDVVRDWLARHLLGLRERAPEAASALEAAAAIVRGYSSREAGEWARAGRMRYVGSVIQRDLSRRLDGQTPAQPKLPHHTLLAKDAPPGAPDDWIRYGLACAFATDVTAKVLEVHFAAPEPDPRFFAEKVAPRLLRHPAEQLALPKVPFEPGRIAKLAERALAGHWRNLLEPTNPIFG